MMLMKPLLAGAALALMFSGAHAQTAPASVAPAPAATAAVQDADPALWVVKDEDTTIYLFGTVHVLKPGLSWFDEAVKAAFDKSDTVVLEMVEPDEATQGSMIQRFALDPSGPTVASLLPEDKRAAYTAAMTEVGIPVAAFDNFDPWFPALILSVATLPKHGYDPNQGAERQITAAAKAANKPIVGLETFEQQLGFFDTMPKDLQVKYLVVTLDALPEVGKTLDRMVERWAAGDPAGLAGLMNEGMRELPEVSKILLNDRNARWAEWIEKRMAQPGTVFIAVGAGHLAGSGSVQDFLAKRNLKAQRVAY